MRWHGHMTRVLILGGTGWLSGRIAQRWLDAGAEVTCLARGARPVPTDAVLVPGDREVSGAYDEVSHRDWDEVIDVSSVASHVQQAIEALGARAARWTYVSSMSVYADDTTIGTDERAPLQPSAQDGEEYDYGREKVAAEIAVRTLGDRAQIVRPGLIVGEGDPSDRFGYWAAAFDRAADEPVLLPPLSGRMTQVIDVDDVATYIVSGRGTGAVNAIGNAQPLAEVLRRVRAATGHTGELIEGDEDWLTEHGVSHWSGGRSLPLWLPADMPGFMARRNTAYTSSGGLLSPLDESIGRVVDDERARGIDRIRRAGLTRDDERALLAELH